MARFVRGGACLLPRQCAEVLQQEGPVRGPLAASEWRLELVREVISDIGFLVGLVAYRGPIQGFTLDAQF